MTDGSKIAQAAGKVVEALEPLQQEQRERVLRAAVTSVEHGSPVWDPVKAAADFKLRVQHLPPDEQRRLYQQEIALHQSKLDDLKAERGEIEELFRPAIEATRADLMAEVREQYGTPGLGIGIEPLEHRNRSAGRAAAARVLPDLLRKSDLADDVAEAVAHPSTESIARVLGSEPMTGALIDKHVTTRPRGATLDDSVRAAAAGPIERRFSGIAEAAGRVGLPTVWQTRDIGLAEQRAAGWLLPDSGRGYAVAETHGVGPSVAGMREISEAVWQKLWMPRFGLGDPGEEPPDIGEETMLAHFSALWRSRGFPTFEVTASLAAALSMTECRGLLGRDFRSPFPAVAIQLPEPSPVITLGQGGRQLAKVAVFHRFLYTGKPYCVFGLIMAEDARSIMIAGPGEEEELDHWLSRLAVVPEDAAALRFLAGLFSYINGLHAPPAPEGKRKPGASARPRAGAPPQPQRFVIGREIKLSPGLLQAARVEASAALAGERATKKQREAYSLHTRFVVRGHFRNQAFGLKHAERRRQWIEPFWKGPELAEGLARLYAVEGEEPKP